MIKNIFSINIDLKLTIGPNLQAMVRDLQFAAACAKNY